MVSTEKQTGDISDVASHSVSLQPPLLLAAGSEVSCGSVGSKKTCGFAKIEAVLQKAMIWLQVLPVCISLGLAVCFSILWFFLILDLIFL